MCRQFGFECRDQGPVLRVDRTDAAEVQVVLGDLVQPRRRDVAPGSDVCEERADVVRSFGPAEGEHQQGIVAPRLVVETRGVRHLRTEDGHVTSLASTKLARWRPRWLPMDTPRPARGPVLPGGFGASMPR